MRTEDSVRRDFTNWLDTLGRQIDRTFERAEAIFDEVFEAEPNLNGDAFPFPTGFRHHVKAGKERVEIFVEVPGLSAEHVNVRLESPILIVEAKAKDIVPGKSFEVVRRFRVNQHVQPEHISASVKNGLLTVIVTPPEKPKAEGRTIPVSPG